MRDIAHRHIPTAPGALPFIGNIPQLRRRPLDFVRSLRSHGDIVRFRLGPRVAYAVNSPALLQQMLVADARLFEKGKMFAKGRLVSRNGLFTSEGDFHLRQRRLIQPAFHKARIRHYTGAMHELARERVDSWQDGQEILLDQELLSLSLATVTKALFSTSIGKRLSEDVRRALPIILDGLGRRALAPIDALDRLPTPMNRRFDRALATLKNVVHRIIADYRADTDGGLASGDLLSMLLTARDEETGAGMSDEQVYDEVVAMLIAGAETTAGALSWACYQLSRHDEVQQRLQGELDGMLGGRRVEEVAYEDLRALGYEQQVIAETLRLHPSTWMLMRQPITDVDLGGYRIPAGATVLFSIYALHRDPELFPHPELFDPDRWRPDRAAKIPRGAYMPFGNGIRGCAGEQFARAELAVFLSVIFSRCSIRPVPGKSVHPVTRLITAPSSMPMIVQRRS
ncbi:cytochrome P450 [Streptomyces sp. NPDC053427]|uniref:cytochrome P450 n=1 Tax=Streptomyces sp. NPDC053427 TaxID=3365701 RepID=UPI0037D87ACF